MEVLAAIGPSLGTFIFLIFLGFWFGRWNERRHFERLVLREKDFAHIKVMTLKTLPDQPMASGQLVSGNVVIAQDYFKMIAALVRRFFGGKLRSYETLLERARREAVLRLQRQAEALGAHAVYNVRFEASPVGVQTAGNGGPSSGVELFAYGTAVTYA